MIRFFVLILSILPFLSVAQERTIHFKNLYSKKADTPVVFASQHNEIIIYWEGLQNDDFTIEAANSLYVTLRERDHDTCLIYCSPMDGVPDNGTIKFIKKNTRKILAETPYFVYRPNNNLLARLGGIRDSSAYKEDILSSSIFETYSNDPLFNARKFFKIISYTFSCTTSQQNYNINVRGRSLTNDVKNIIRDLPHNTIVKFTEIKVTCPDCRLISLPDLEILVK